MSAPLPSSAVTWWGLFYTYLFFGFIAGATVVALMLFFIIKNRVKSDSVVEPSEPTAAEERGTFKILIAFFLIMSVVLGSLALLSYPTELSLVTPPKQSGSMVIDVTAFQWNYMFKYPNGAVTVGEVMVPTGTTIIFNVTSSDVNHSFDLPDFKMQIQAIPGTYNTLWLVAPSVPNASETNYTIQCTQLCGVGHTFMVAKLIAMDPAAFNQWYATSNGTSSSTNSTATAAPPVMITLYAGEVNASAFGFGNSSGTITSPGPSLKFHVNDTVMIVFSNAGAMYHSFAVVDSLGPNYNVLFNSSVAPVAPGQAATVTFTCTQAGSFYYICTVPGHVQLGMWGNFIVS
jgi:cytochrome c oxidase subunit 2